MNQTSVSNLAADSASVRRILDRKGSAVHAIRPDDTIGTAVVTLRDKKVGALVVTNAEGDLKGILSERDIVRKMAETPGQTLPQKVSENMTRDVVTCTPDDKLVEVLRQMSDGRFRHMPVMDDGKLCGVLTIGDLIAYRLSELEYEALHMKQMIAG